MSLDSAFSVILCDISQVTTTFGLLSFAKTPRRLNFITCNLLTLHL
jgi:hypothetical protein